jgi:hypothetical protein
MTILIDNDGRCRGCGLIVNGDKGRHGIPACRVCREHLHDAKSVARCFTAHPLPASPLEDEIIMASDAPEEAVARLGRLAEFFDGIERWQPYALLADNGGTP